MVASWYLSLFQIKIFTACHSVFLADIWETKNILLHLEEIGFNKPFKWSYESIKQYCKTVKIVNNQRRESLFLIIKVWKLTDNNCSESVGDEERKVMWNSFETEISKYFHDANTREFIAISWLRFSDREKYLFSTFNNIRRCSSIHIHHHRSAG